jgi:hypothetical protein
MVALPNQKYFVVGLRVYRRFTTGLQNKKRFLINFSDCCWQIIKVGET